MRPLISKMIGTIAVILVLAGVIASRDLLTRIQKRNRKWQYIAAAGIIGGVFGIYGTMSGEEMNGALLSVRDIGPMLAGYLGGPLGGLLGGLIAGIYRYLQGGITANACIAATCTIGVSCGLLSQKLRKSLMNPWIAFLIGAAMETLHLIIVLILVKPFETAKMIVNSISVPFILVNAAGFSLMMSMINYIRTQRKLVEEQARIKSDLEAAKTIQQSLLPQNTEDETEHPEFRIKAYIEPARTVGGDYYDYFILDESRLVFLIADVSGKGIPAALFMVTARMTLHNAILNHRNLSDAVSEANTRLYSGNKTGMFVTAWIGILDLKTGGLDYVNAGHNPPVLMSGGDLRYLRDRSGFVLGGLEEMKYRQFHLDLEKNDTLFLYTDGVTEAEGPEHALYGNDMLINCLYGCTEQQPDEILETVKKSVGEFTDGTDQFDDITMLCLKYLQNS